MFDKIFFGTMFAITVYACVAAAHSIHLLAQIVQ